MNRRADVVRSVAVKAGLAFFVSGTSMALPLSAQKAPQLQSASESSFDATPQTRMRPIGEPSLVDQYESQTSSPDRSASQTQQVSRSREAESPRETSVRYAARQSTVEVPSLRDANQATATSSTDDSPFPVRQTVFQSPADQVPNPAPALPADPNAGGGMGMPGVAPPLPGTSASPDGFAPVETAPGGTVQDTAPIPVPRLDDQMATLDNCSCISAPSSYTAGGSWGCGTETASPGTFSQPGIYVPPPAIVAPPIAPAAYVPNNVGHRPLFTLGQDAYNAQLGRGIIGQPTAYVPGQRVRNFLRYLTP